MKKRDIWSLENFNDGYIDNRGRFRVYYPNHIRAYSDGYILRAIIAYETYNNVTTTKSDDIHHIDKNRLNDSKENLIKLSHSEHSKFHNKEKNITLTCKNCGKEFIRKAWRKNKFCSAECYQLYPKNEETKKKMSKSQKKAWELNPNNGMTGKTHSEETKQKMKKPKKKKELKK